MSGGSVNLLQSTFLFAVTVPRPASAKTVLMQPKITSLLLAASATFGAAAFFFAGGFFFALFFAAFFVAITFSLTTERQPDQFSLPPRVSSFAVSALFGRFFQLIGMVILPIGLYIGVVRNDVPTEVR